MDPRGTVGRIYKEEHYILLQTKYESSGPCGFGEEDFFYVLPMTPQGGACMDPRGTVGRIYMKALGLVVSEKKIFFMFYP